MLVVPQSTQDQKPRAALGKSPHRLHIRAIAFEQPVGNVDHRIDVALVQIARQQRRRRRTVDIVVAENRDAFVAFNRIRDPFRRRFHCGQHIADRASPV